MEHTPKVICVIPARLGSTRLARKALRTIEGKTLVERVWSQARASSQVTEVVIATDSEEIAAVVNGFGGRAVITSPEISCGSARVAVAAAQIGGSWDIVLNVQGDMPFISPAIIDRGIEFLRDNPNFTMSTVAVPIEDSESFLSKSVVKVVVGRGDRALYFSRAPIPHSRDGELPIDPLSGKKIFGFKHIGYYLFRPSGLDSYRGTVPSPLEQIEMLEQLRHLELGHEIGVCILEPELTASLVEVDTEDDLARATMVARGKS